jgi:hypothetical protein
MASKGVGGLYISVGVDASQAIRAMDLLHARMAATAATISASESKAAEAAAGGARTRAGTAAAASKVVQKTYRDDAKAAVESAAVQARAAKAAASARTGALKRGGSDFLTAGAAGVSGNTGYALAGLGQGLIKLTGAAKGSSMALAGTGVAAAALAVAAIAAEAGVLSLTLQLTEFGVKTAASFQTLEIQLAGLLGGAKKGREELDWLLELGKTSIVPTESLIAADRQLAAFGVEAEKQRRGLVQFISDFGTATSATEQQIYFLSLAMGQVAARGKADMVDLKQLGNAGVVTKDVYKAVASEIGTSWQKVRDGVKDGIITSDLLIKAVQKIGQEYQGTAKRAMLSTNGLISNIKDIITVGMGRAFEGLNERIAGVLKTISDTVNKIDFSHIATAVETVISYISAALGGISQNGTDAVYFFNNTLPQAINVAGAVLGGFIRIMRTWWEVLMMQYNAIEGIVAAAIWGFAKLGSAASDIMDKLGAISDEEGARNRAYWDGVVRSSESAMSNVVKDFQSSYGIIADTWQQPLYKTLYFQITPLQAAVNTGQVPKEALLPQTDAVKKILSGIGAGVGGHGSGVGSSSGGGGGSKTNPALEAAKKLIEVWKDLIATAIKGRDALADAFRVPFAKKIVQGGGKPITAAFTAFTSGDVSTIVNQYKTIKQALTDFYSLAEAKGGKVGKAIKNQRKQDIAFLKAQTGELVRLATEAEQIGKKLEKAQESYDRVIAEIDKRRTELGQKVAKQQAAIARQYDGFYTAISATEGTFTEGAIAIAERALDAATSAYESAQAKLDELRSARDSFLQEMRDVAWSFVNDLSKVNEEITRFTRLDEIGSFSSTTEQSASTDTFIAGLKARLEALKKFASDVRSLVSAGLNKDVVQQILQAGPEEGGAIASALAGASSQEIADINAVQAELAQVISGMQTEASAAWFDAGIAAQEAFTAPLKAAMEAAQTQVTELTRQKDLALGILEAWQFDQNALLDQQDADALARYEVEKANLQAALDANTAATAKVAKAIDKRLAELPDTAYAQGMSTIDGLIKGLSDEAKLKELRAAAREMAEQVRRTVNSTLEIHSPSQVMVQSGYAIGEGLAVGMGLSAPLVAEAATGLATTAVGTIGGDGASQGGGDTLVKVYIGDQELRDIVGYEVVKADQQAGSYVMTGRRL